MSAFIEWTGIVAFAIFLVCELTLAIFFWGPDA